MITLLWDSGFIVVRMPIISEVSCEKSIKFKTTLMQKRPNLETISKLGLYQFFMVIKCILTKSFESYSSSLSLP